MVIRETGHQHLSFKLLQALIEICQVIPLLCEFDRQLHLSFDQTLRSPLQINHDRTAVLDLIMPVMATHGANKLQIYYVGPYDTPFARMSPYVDIGSYCDEKAPGHNEKNYYDYFFAGLHGGWQKWLADPAELAKRGSLITVIPPYDDAAGGGLVMTLFHPVWSRDRKSLGGAIGFDIALAKIVESIKDVKLAETGFAFLAQSDGNVLAINNAGAARLGLQGDTTKGESGGLAMLKRVFKDSKEPEIKNLKLPEDTSVDYHEIQLDGRRHIIVLKRLRALNNLVNEAIAPDQWTLGFVVPKEELYRSLDRAQDAIEVTRTSLTKSQALITVGSLVIVMLGVYLVSRRMTGALVALSEGASAMREGDYGVRVASQSEDEIGQLTIAFNEMAAEIQAHTTNLEELVKARTSELEDANKEITSLNAQLAQENLRLGAELNVARQLQLMVLPDVAELHEIKELDIAGYMAPADEVGGDYYDVLRATASSRSVLVT